MCVCVIYIYIYKHTYQLGRVEVNLEQANFLLVLEFSPGQLPREELDQDIEYAPEVVAPAQFLGQVRVDRGIPMNAYRHVRMHAGGCNGRPSRRCRSSQLHHR